jgi:zinc finger protein
MSNSTQQETKANGAAFDDFFESLGKKAEHLTINEQKVVNASPVAVNGTTAQSDEDDDQKVVDEIESLCMNCHENVAITRTLSPLDFANALRHREQHVYFSHEFPSFAKS